MSLHPYVNLKEERVLDERVPFRSEMVVHYQPMTFMIILNTNLKYFMPLQWSNRIVSVHPVRPTKRLPLCGQLRIESKFASPQCLLLNRVDDIGTARKKQIQPISPRDDRRRRERYGNCHSIIQKSMSPVPPTTCPGNCILQ